jgi:arabinofuranosyltransferase
MQIVKEKEAKSSNRLSANTFIVISLLVFCFLVYLGSIISQRHMIFDDSFITYRYARNLANGYGITWNPNEAPVEGYTNFLLVIILAPFIKFGADPLLVTRLISIISAVFMCIILYRLSRNEYGATNHSAFLIAISFLLFTNTDFLIILGLETVFYAASLFLSFAIGAQYLNSNDRNLGYLFGLFTFTAFLLRPEAVFIIAAFIVTTGIINWEKKGRLKSLFALWMPVGITFVLPLLAYLLWKYLYFGTILPNPFYIKVSASQLYSPLGINSILEFLTNYRFLIALAGISFFAPANDKTRQGRLFASLFCLFCIVFYVRVDTLMDKGGRFLYPVTIFLMYLATPILLRVFDYLLSETQHWGWKIPLFFGIFILAINPSSISQTVTNFEAISQGRESQTQSPLMLKEYKVALELSKYPNIKKMRIAFGDAGVIPYFSEALSLDDVGLNDRFIATHTDLGQLTDYYFAQQPDLAMLTSNQDIAWTNNGHGHLGNFAKWSKDERWDRYSYAGTIKTDGSYDIQLFIRNDLDVYEEFKSYLQEQVADGMYDKFPLPIGSYKLDNNAQSAWIPAN